MSDLVWPGERDSEDQVPDSVDTDHQPSPSRIAWLRKYVPPPIYGIISSEAPESLLSEEARGPFTAGVPRIQDVDYQVQWFLSIQHVTETLWWPPGHNIYTKSKEYAI